MTEVAKDSCYWGKSARVFLARTLVKQGFRVLAEQQSVDRTFSLAKEACQIDSKDDIGFMEK